MQNFESNDVLANLFANAIRSPQPSTSSAVVASSPAAARPTLAHSKSIGAEPTTPRRPQQAVKRSRRSAVSFSSSATPTLTVYHSARKGGSVSPPQSSHHHHHHHSSSSSHHHNHQGGGAYSPFAGARFTDSPSARAIPLPPTAWFEDDESPCPPSDTESIMSSDSSSSSDSLPSSSAVSRSGELSPSGALASLNHSMAGMRVTPLQLIAACSAL